MNTPIMVSPTELFTVTVAICGAIVTVAAAMAVISNAVKKLKEPETKQDARITALEEAISKINERLELGNRRFEADTRQIEALEQSFKTSNKVIIASLQALTAHALDQNSLEELHEAKKSLDEYLRER